MSQPVQPPAPARTDLETIVRWPLIYACVAAVLVPLLVVAALAISSALRPAPRPGVARQAQPPRPKTPAPARRVRQRAPEPARPAEPPELAELKLNPSVGWAKPVRAGVEAPAPPVAASLPEGKTGVVPYDEYRRFKRRSHRSESELMRVLREGSKEVDLRTDSGAVRDLLDRAHAARGKGRDRAEAREHPLLAYAGKRPDLRGLPLLRGRDCVSGKEATKLLGTISKEVRAVAPVRARRGGGSVPAYAEFARSGELADLLHERKRWRKDAAVGALVQVFGAESTWVRTELVKALEATKGRAATVALARVAVFDLSPLVRQAAVGALKKRPAGDARPVLLSALRYPWAPAADHAAEALVALGDRGAVKELKALLAQPDPRAPFEDKDGKWKVREVVRVNHLRNCLLCHAPSPDRRDPVRGLVPTPGEPLPVVYYEAREGTFVRADVTYLRQDFSTVERVEKPGKWPEQQRFDYLVRTRELTAKEWARLPEPPRAKAEAMYPQRRAVLFALAELSATRGKARRE